MYSSILGFNTQHISTCLFKVQCTIGCDVTSIWIENEEEAGTCWGIEEGIGLFFVDREKYSLWLMKYFFSELLSTSASCAEARGNFTPGKANSEISKSMLFAMKRGALSLIS
uniref:Uncharacterized protein n=1 Tax=Capra hircus TaxID=9925 RepID=A0A8C2P3T7_CAPHI